MNISIWFKGIRAKLLMTTVIPVAAVGFMTYMSFAISNSLGSRLDYAYEDTIPSQDAIAEMMETRMTVGYRIWSVLGSGEDLKYRETTLKSLGGSVEDFKKAIAKFEAIPASANEQEIYKPFKDISKVYLDMNDAILADLTLNTPESIARVMGLVRGGEWQKKGSVARNSFKGLVEYYATQSAKLDAEQTAERKTAETWITAVGAGSLLGLVAILMYIANNLATAVGTISGKINQAGAQVTAAIEQLSAAGQSLSQSSTQAAASLEETVASLEEMTSMVTLSSDNAKQAASLSGVSRESAERGQSEIQSLVSSMNDISQSSRKIEEIINVIDDIAFQTNLLALNAAVEAARAGEQGKGFAVVAEAVRTLAQRSAEAAKDITTLIKDSVDKIERGTKIADKSGAVMAEIVTSVKKVSDLAEEIATGSSEQKTGIQQISKAMNDLDSSSQGNAASSEEIASTAEEISAQSMQMQKMMEDMSVMVNGRDSGAPPVASSSVKPSSAANKVVEFKKSPAPKAKTTSADFLPFDEDEDGGRGKIGKISGF